MENLKRKHAKFIASMNALERSIKLFSRADISDELKEALAASLIKHYELCYESSWKFLKIYLEKRYDLKVDSPKKVFKECFPRGLIDEETVEELLGISDARNSTAHDYNE